MILSRPRDGKAIVFTPDADIYLEDFTDDAEWAPLGFRGGGAPARVQGKPQHRLGPLDRNELARLLEQGREVEEQLAAEEARAPARPVQPAALPLADVVAPPRRRISGKSPAPGAARGRASVEPDVDTPADDPTEWFALETRGGLTYGDRYDGPIGYRMGDRAVGFTTGPAGDVSISLCVGPPPEAPQSDLRTSPVAYNVLGQGAALQGCHRPALGDRVPRLAHQRAQDHALALCCHC